MEQGNKETKDTQDTQFEQAQFQFEQALFEQALADAREFLERALNHLAMRESVTATNYVREALTILENQGL